MQATAYVRVSSKAQNHATQRSMIERAAPARGDTIGAWYGEKLSGKSLDRPELARLGADARAGHVRRLYVGLGGRGGPRSGRRGPPESAA